MTQEKLPHRKELCLQSEAAVRRLSPCGSVSQVSGQDVNELGVGRRLLQLRRGNQIQKTVVWIIPTALNERAEVAFDTTGRGIKMCCRLRIEAFGNEQHIFRLIPNLLHHIDRIAKPCQLTAQTKETQ